MKIQFKGLTLAISAGLVLAATTASGKTSLPAEIFKPQLGPAVEALMKNATGIYTVDNQCGDLNNKYLLSFDNGRALNPNDFKDSTLVIYPSNNLNYVQLSVVGLAFDSGIDITPGAIDEKYDTRDGVHHVQKDEVTVTANSVVNKIVGDHRVAGNFMTGPFKIPNPFAKSRLRALTVNRDGSVSLTMPMGSNDDDRTNNSIQCTLTRKAGEPQEIFAMAARLSKIHHAKAYGGILDYSGAEMKDPAEETDPQKIAQIQAVNRVIRAIVPPWLGPCFHNTCSPELKRMYSPDGEVDTWADEEN